MNSENELTGVRSNIAFIIAVMLLLLCFASAVQEEERGIQPIDPNQSLTFSDTY